MSLKIPSFKVVLLFEANAATYLYTASFLTTTYERGHLYVKWEVHQQLMVITVEITLSVENNILCFA